MATARGWRRNYEKGMYACEEDERDARATILEDRGESAVRETEQILTRRASPG